MSSKGELRLVAGRTTKVILDLIGDTIAMAALIGSITLISWLLEQMIRAPELKLALTTVHDVGSTVIFAIFLYVQIRKYWIGGIFHVLVLAT